MADQLPDVSSLNETEWTERGPAILEMIGWVQRVVNEYPRETWHNHLPGTDAVLAEPLPPALYLRRQEPPAPAPRVLPPAAGGENNEPSAAPNAPRWRAS